MYKRWKDYVDKMGEDKWPKTLKKLQGKEEDKTKETVETEC
jgi:hypothetical protein